MRRKLKPRVGERVYLPDDYDGRLNVPHVVAAVEAKGFATIVTLVPADVWEHRRDSLTAAEVLASRKTPDA